MDAAPTTTRLGRMPGPVQSHLPDPSRTGKEDVMLRTSVPAWMAAMGSLLLSTSVLAHSGDTVPAAYGTAVIDGVASPGEWDAATSIPVFSGLIGSRLFVMDDLVNLYLGLFVPDPTFTDFDQFVVRIDSPHDGSQMVGDDELFLTAPAQFHDGHFNGTFWGNDDSQQDGTGAAGTSPEGHFFEVAHPLNSGDPDDLYVFAGATIGLCVRYSNDGVGSGADVHPGLCFNTVNQQNLYLDYVTSAGQVDVPSVPSLASGQWIAPHPNPVERGAVLEIRYRVPGDGTTVNLSLYSVSGRKVEELVSGFREPGEHVLRWVVPAAPGSLAPGIFFLRARFERFEARSGLLVVQ